MRMAKKKCINCALCRPVNTLFGKCTHGKADTTLWTDVMLNAFYCGKYKPRHTGRTTTKLKIGRRRKLWNL